MISKLLSLALVLLLQSTLSIATDEQRVDQRLPESSQSHGLRRVQKKGKGKGKGGGAWANAWKMDSKSKGSSKSGKSHKGNMSYKGKGSKLKKGAKGKIDDYYYYYDACSPIIDGVWSYASDAATQFFSDIGADGFIDPGDTFIFNEAPVAVSIDVTLITTGSLSGTCTATPELVPEREYCVLTFEFGELGTVAVQGPLEEMTIVGATGCFWHYGGEIVGFLDADTYFFYMNAMTGR